MYTLMYYVAVVALAAVLFKNADPFGFAVGMVAFFIGVVRAPVTGIILVTEMTANVTMLLPMLGAGFVAMLVPMLLRDPPIYDSLRAGTLRREPEHPTKIITPPISLGQR